jgi:hypothetical protein
MIFIERLSELLRGLLPARIARLSDPQTNTKHDLKDESSSDCKANPWTKDLERLSCYSREEPAETGRTESGEIKIQLLMEQARLEKAKEILKQQQQRLKLGEAEPEADKKPERRKVRTCDATITDGKAWWGQSVATWNPDDAKNLGPQGEQRHPRQHKWFNQ